MKTFSMLLAAGITAALDTSGAPPTTRAAPPIKERARTAIDRRRRARGSLGVLCFLAGRPLRRVVRLEHYRVLARRTAGIKAPVADGLVVVRVPPNSSTLRRGRLVEGATPPPTEGLPRGRSVWLGVRDEDGVLRGRACLELEPERGPHRGWNPPLRKGEAVTSGLWIDPSVRTRGAGMLLVQSLIATARDEYGIRTVYGIVHRYNTASMLAMRVVAGFSPAGEAWVLRLGRRRFALGSTLHRPAEM